MCLAHLEAALDAAGSGETAFFLLRDGRRRLAGVRHALDGYERKRDYRYADEPKGPEQSSWTDVIRRYVGDRE